MTPQELLLILSQLPWQTIVQVFTVFLQGIDGKATNPLEKFALETVIALLQRIVPPSPTL